MDREFSGKTEQDAINKAIEELHIEREDFDVEVIDNGRRGLFKKADVKIRVHVDTSDESDEKSSYNVIEAFSDYEDYDNGEENNIDYPVDEKLESEVCNFISELGKHMGFDGKAEIESRSGNKILVNIKSDDSGLVIGRKGKNLDALQVIINAYAAIINPERRIVLDSEGYKVRHDEQIIHNAYKVAQVVRKTGRSRILEPMNPYERHLVHTALGDLNGIETKSEGEGLIKQIRVSLKPGYNRGRYSRN